MKCREEQCGRCQAPQIRALLSILFVLANVLYVVFHLPTLVTQSR